MCLLSYDRDANDRDVEQAGLAERRFPARFLQGTYRPIFWKGGKFDIVLPAHIGAIYSDFQSVLYKASNLWHAECLREFHVVWRSVSLDIVNWRASRSDPSALLRAKPRASSSRGDAMTKQGDMKHFK